MSKATEELARAKRQFKRITTQEQLRKYNKHRHNPRTKWRWRG